VFFEAFPDLRMVYARRNPIDLVYSWHKKDWGRRIGYEERSLWLAFVGGNGEAIPKVGNRGGSE